ncbi:glycerol ethanol, ferric requiring protein [Kappamyces sp. JEL0680]|nr:glycerol ethanol, ferric requiring protein [Kappamyces sp. JEL0680]
MTPSRYNSQDTVAGRPGIAARESSFRRNRQGSAVDKYEGFQTIDWMRDWVKDHVDENHFAGSWPELLVETLQGAQTWILLSITGISIGALVSSIDIVTAYLSDLKRGVCLSQWYLSKDICCISLARDGAYCQDYVPWSQYLFQHQYLLLDWLLYIIFSLGYSLAAAVLVLLFNIDVAGSGLSELKVILGGFSIRGLLEPITLAIRSMALPLSVSSLGLGKEAPMIHLASCVGNSLSHWFPKYRNNEARRREVISASSAAGLAVAFGAPIGGVLVSLEGLSSYFPAKTMLRSFFCALVASVTLQVFDPYRGKRVLYQVSYTRNWLLFEIIFFVLLGALGGLCGSLFIQIHHRVQEYRRSHSIFANHPLLEIVALSLVTSILSYLNIFTRVDGSELLESLFRECSKDEHLGLCSLQVKLTLLASLVWTFLVKAFLGLCAYGTVLPGGLFAPTMVCGALLGRLLGEIIQSMQTNFPGLFLFASCPPEGPCITPGMYALLGALAAFSSFTKWSVSVIVIMFELTGTLNYVVPCMITLITAKIFGDFWETNGFLESVIKMRGYPYLDPRKENILTTSVSDKMTPLADLVCLYETGMALADVQAVVAQHRFQGYPIIAAKLDARLCGYIERHELQSLIDRQRQTSNTNLDAALVSFEAASGGAYPDSHALQFGDAVDRVGCFAG